MWVCASLWVIAGWSAQVIYDERTYVIVQRDDDSANNTAEAFCKMLSLRAPHHRQGFEDETLSSTILCVDMVRELLISTKDAHSHSIALTNLMHPAATSSNPIVTVIWQTDPADSSNTADWLRFLLAKTPHREVVDGKFEITADNAIVVYDASASDPHNADSTNLETQQQIPHH